MGIFDKIKDLVTSTEEYYEEDEGMEEAAPTMAEEPEEREVRKPRREASTTPFPAEKRNKYVNISATTNLQVVLVKPERYDEAPSIVDHLNNKRTVVLNLETTARDDIRRIVDFLSGAAYAINGQMKRVAAKTFIVTPFNVDIMGDLVLDELESSNLYL